MPPGWRAPWSSTLDSDPFAEPPAAPGPDPGPDAGADPVRLTVTLDGERHQLAWPRTTPLLDLLRGAGLDAPFSCREGRCSSCSCKVSSGEVAMTRNEVLEQVDLDEGWVLACQSLPVTDVVEVSYDD